MAPNRRKGGGRGSAAAAAARQWKVGDLVLAKVKGFPAWPATVSEPQKWGYSTNWKKVLVYFFGTKQIAFCNPADVEAFTEEKKKTLLVKRQGKGADFIRAVEEIIDSYEKYKNRNQDHEFHSGDEGTVSNNNNASSEGCKTKPWKNSPKQSPASTRILLSETLCASVDQIDSCNVAEIPMPSLDIVGMNDIETVSEETIRSAHVLNQLRQTPLGTVNSSRKRSKDEPLQRVRSSRSSSRLDPSKSQKSNDGMAPNEVSDETVKKNKLIQESPCTSDYHDLDLLVYSATVTSNGCGFGSELVTAESDAISVNEDNTTQSNSKVGEDGIVGEYLENGFDRSGKVDLGTAAVVLKKKRKHNRKRIIHDAFTCSRSDKEMSLRVGLRNDLPCSPSAGEYSDDKLHKTDGDKHLPLVKRARVRMEKPPMDRKVDDLVEERLVEEVTANLSETDTMVSNCDDNHLADRTLLGPENLSPSENCIQSIVSNSHLCEAQKSQLRGRSVHSEAALPPSKRLHRALEAMSANVAEEALDIEDLAANEMHVNCCRISDDDIGSPSKSLNIHFADGTTLANGTSCLPSGSAPPTLKEPRKTSLEEKAVEEQGCFKSTKDENCEEMLIDVRNLMNAKVLQCIVSEFADENICVKNTVPCPPHVDEKLDDEKISQSISNISSLPAEENSIETMEPYKEFSDDVLKREAVCPSQVDETLDEVKTSQSTSNPSPPVEENSIEIIEPSKEFSDDLLKREAGCSKEGTIDGEHEIPLPTLQRAESGARDIGSDNCCFSNGTNVILSVANGGLVAGSTSKNMNILKSQSDWSTKSRDILELPKEIKRELIATDRDISSYSTPMKVLIAAAQFKRHDSRSTSISDRVSDDKVVSDVVSNLPRICGLGSSGCVYSSSPSNNGSRSPAASEHQKGFMHDMNAVMYDSISTHRQKPVGQVVGHDEANAAWRSFKSVVETLSRTKDSIGRATRFAMDCAKYGIADEVVGFLLRNLESESSLHRKVDLFFLVDSIAQGSRGHKGVVGDAYHSAIQAMLPRLLSAAAPPGNAARENRRQCLKVLRLWLERKTLSESVVWHHIRELDSYSEPPYNSAYSRRLSRTERALNDPLREMEGMLVDEYGSNTNFQLPGFIMPRMLEDHEEECGTDENVFEAVTPERDLEIPNEALGRSPTLTAEKHRHILEDVDGELEMEDVAPALEVEVDSSCHQKPFVPPLPEAMPPSPPPLPVSPPPVPPPPPSCLPLLSAVSRPFSEPADPHLYKGSHSLPHTTPQHPCTSSLNSSSSESARYCSAGYGDLSTCTQTTDSSYGSSSFRSLHGSQTSMQNVNNNIQQFGCGPPPTPSKAYHLQPPPPMVSNQFSYIQADSQQQTQSRMNCSPSTFAPRSNFVNETHGGNFFGHQSRLSEAQHEIEGKYRLSTDVDSGTPRSEKVGDSFSHVSYSGPSSEPSQISNLGWPLPRHPLNYRLPNPNLQPPVNNPISGASNFWRPR